MYTFLVEYPQDKSRKQKAESRNVAVVCDRRQFRSISAYTDYTDKEVEGRDGSPSRPVVGRLGEASLPIQIRVIREIHVKNLRENERLRWIAAQI